MNTAERLHRRRCIGLRVAVVFAVFLAVLNGDDWAIVAVAAVGGLVAVVGYWRDCRGSRSKTTQSDTHSRGL
jgi:uncharacterized membrane protein YjjP (DUF1212 family)